MKTGKSNAADGRLPRGLRVTLSAGLIVFLEKAIDSAVLYKEHAKRDITEKDVLLALKREIFIFGDRNDIESQVEDTKKELNQMSDTSESDFEFDELSYTESEVSVDNSADSGTRFTYSTCTCKLCTEINEVDEKWNNWTPQTPLEKTLYRAIEMCSCQCLEELNDHQNNFE